MLGKMKAKVEEAKAGVEGKIEEKKAEQKAQKKDKLMTSLTDGDWQSGEYTFAPYSEWEKVILGKKEKKEKKDSAMVKKKKKEIANKALDKAEGKSVKSIMMLSYEGVAKLLWTSQEQIKAQAPDAPITPYLVHILDAIRATVLTYRFDSDKKQDIHKKMETLREASTKKLVKTLREMVETASAKVQEVAMNKEAMEGNVRSAVESKRDETLQIVMSSSVFQAANTMSEGQAQTAVGEAMEFANQLQEMFETHAKTKVDALVSIVVEELCNLPQRVKQMVADGKSDKDIRRDLVKQSLDLNDRMLLVIRSTVGALFNIMRMEVDKANRDEPSEDESDDDE